MKVLVTGALGNIGFSTLEALLVEGHDVVAFDLESRRARQLASGFDGRVQFVWGDITNWNRSDSHSRAWMRLSTWRPSFLPLQNEFPTSPRK